MVDWIKKIRSYNRSGYLNLRNVFRPLHILLTILGLFPYSIKYQTNNNNHRFSIIQKSIYYNSICALAYVIILLFFLIVHVRFIYYSIEFSVLTEGIMTQLNYITELLSLSMFCFVTYVCTFLNRFKYLKILNVLASRIDLSTGNINSAKILRNLRFQINVVVIGSIILILFMQICVNFTRRDGLWKMFLVFFSFNLPQMIQFTYIAFFYILMEMSVEILKNVREQTSVLAKIKNIYADGLTNVYSRQRVLTLRQMEIIYMDISKLTQTVNQVFEAPILVTMMQCFHSIVSESHIIYHGIVVENKLESHEIVNCSVWIVYQFMKVYAIARAGHLFKVEVLKLGRAIHSIPTERHDLRFMMEVQHFSSMMSFQTNELTVFGYFPLDATLTFKIVAAAAMYIIILVQFDKAK